MTGPRRFVVGSYTSDGPAPSLHLAERAADGAWRITASATTSNPSFVARAGELLVSVQEDVAGGLRSWRIVDGELVAVDALMHGAAHPCHVSTFAGQVMATNYNGGSVTIARLDASGRWGASRTLAMPMLSGPVQDRQEGPHPHQCVRTPWGTWLVSDLGADRVHELTVSPDGHDTRLTRSSVLPPGSGPRHLVVRPGGIHVAGELDGRVHTLEQRPAGLHWTGGEPVAERGRADEVIQPSHLELSPSGALVTALVRGVDTLAVFEAVGARRLRPVATHALPLPWPRHHAHLDERTVVVAAQGGDALVEVDLFTGASRVVLDVAEPACVLPLGDFSGRPVRSLRRRA